MNKKKILFVTNHFRFSNGVASVLRNLIMNLDSDKYKISLLALYDFNEEFAKPIIDKITVIKGFGFYKRGFDKLVNLVSPSFLYKKFIKEKYDIEVAFQYGVPTKMIAKSKNPRKICWMHTFDSKMRLKKYYKSFPLVINVSQSGMKKFVDCGFSPMNSAFCYNLIGDSNVFSLSKQKIDIIKKHKFVFITIARLSPDKAFFRYFEAIKEVVKQRHDIEFWIVGGGSEEQKLKSFVRENGLQEFIIMIGKQDNPYKYLINADLYFCCSYREGFSTACQEASLLGKPVITVDVDGARELIDMTQAGKVIKNDKESIILSLKGFNAFGDELESWKRNAEMNSHLFLDKVRIDKILSMLDEVGKL